MDRLTLVDEWWPVCQIWGQVACVSKEKEVLRRPKILDLEDMLEVLAAAKSKASPELVYVCFEKTTESHELRY